MEGAGWDGSLRSPRLRVPVHVRFWAPPRRASYRGPPTGGAGPFLCGGLGLGGLRSQRARGKARRPRRSTATLQTMEFDCEGVRRLLGKVRTGGGPGGPQRSPHRTLPQLTPSLYAPPTPPYPFFFLQKNYCCLDTSTHPDAQAGREVAAVLLPQPSGAGVTRLSLNESLPATLPALKKSRLSPCGSDSPQSSSCARL